MLTYPYFINVKVLHPFDIITPLPKVDESLSKILNLDAHRDELTA